METPIVASIETLKRNNKKCGGEEVMCLVQESVGNEVTKQHFVELLDKLIKYDSVQKNSLEHGLLCLCRRELSFQRVAHKVMNHLESMLMKNCRNLKIL